MPLYILGGCYKIEFKFNGLFNSLISTFPVSIATKNIGLSIKTAMSFIGPMFRKILFWAGWTFWVMKPLQRIDFHIFVKIIIDMLKKNAFSVGLKMWSGMA